MYRNCFSYYLLFFQRFYLVRFHALISLFQIKANKCTHINTTLLTLYHSDIFQSSKSHPQGVQLIRFKSIANKWVTSSGHVTYYTLLTKLNFTSGNSFCWLCCWKVSFVLLEDGVLRAETCRSGIVQIKWC